MVRHHDVDGIANVAVLQALGGDAMLGDLLIELEPPDVRAGQSSEADSHWLTFPLVF